MIGESRARTRDEIAGRETAHGGPDANDAAGGTIPDRQLLAKLPLHHGARLANPLAASSSHHFSHQIWTIACARDQRLL
jgi:hypothetical protein